MCEAICWRRERKENALMGTLANRYGESSSTSTFQQKSKFFLGEHVSMVSLQWKLLIARGYHKVRTALFVVVKLKA